MGEREDIRRLREDKRTRDLEMYNKVNDMHSVVIGNPAAKVQGLHERVHALEKQEKNRGLWITLISAISTGITIIIVHFKDVFK